MCGERVYTLIKYMSFVFHAYYSLCMYNFTYALRVVVHI